MKRKAFTLLEGALSLVLVAVLASATFPALVKNTKKTEGAINTQQAKNLDFDTAFEMINKYTKRSAK